MTSPFLRNIKTQTNPEFRKSCKTNRYPTCSKIDSKNPPPKISFPPGSLLTENPPPEIFMQFFTPVEAG